MYNKVCMCTHWEVIITHWAVVVFRADVTVLLAPVDLKETTAADLTPFLVRSLVHACATYTTNQINTVNNVTSHYPLHLTCAQIQKEEETQRNKKNRSWALWMHPLIISWMLWLTYKNRCTHTSCHTSCLRFTPRINFYSLLRVALRNCIACFYSQLLTTHFHSLR